MIVLKKVTLSSLFWWINSYNDCDGDPSSTPINERKPFIICMHEDITKRRFFYRAKGTG